MQPHNRNFSAKRMPEECLCAVDRVLQNPALALPDKMVRLTEILPSGFSCPEACRVRITLWNGVFETPGFACASLLYRAPIRAEQETAGEVAAYYQTELLSGPCPLLPHESRLIDFVARRLSQIAQSRQRNIGLLVNLMQQVAPDMLPGLAEKLGVCPPGQHKGGPAGKADAPPGFAQKEAAGFFPLELAGAGQSPAPAGWKLDGEREHWRWRHYMAGQLAAALDMEHFGVKGIYLFGSTATGETGAASDIDLIVHVESKTDLAPLRQWLDGWSRALAKINFLQTGHDADRLLDVHFVTDEDIAKGEPFAAKIRSAADPVIPLRVKT